MPNENIEVPGYEQSASRLEFCCFRCLYAIPLCIVGGITGLGIGIAIFLLSLLNNLSVFFLGKRIESLYNLYVKFYAWNLRVGMYFAGTTDERPELSAC